MLDSSEIFKTLTLFPVSCEVATGKFSPYIEKEEAFTVLKDCNNQFRKNFISCKDPYIHEFLSEINGLELNVKLTSTLNELPSYIPILDNNTKDLVTIPSEFPVVGLTLWDILASGVRISAGTYHETSKIIFRKDILSFKSFKNKKVILFNTGPDTLVEWIWYNREECNFFQTLKEIGIWAVSGFDFSVMEGECAFAQAINHKRTLYSNYLSDKIGLISIPLVYALTKHHINRWISWFNLNSNIKCFFVNCQLQKSDYEITQVITSVKAILERIKYLQVILQGFPMNKILEFGVLLERIHFADKSSIKKAQSRTKIHYDDLNNILVSEKRVMESIPRLSTINLVNKHKYIETCRAKHFYY